MSTARPLAEGASGADASKPTTAMVPSAVPSSGIATWSQPSSGCSRRHRRARRSGASPRWCCRGRRPGSARVASNSVVWSPGSVKSRSGSPACEHQADHAVVQPRGDQGAVVVHRVGDLGCGGVGDVDGRRASVADRSPGRSGAAVRERDHGVAGQQDLGAVRSGGAGQVERGEPLDLGTAHVVGDQVAVLDAEQRAAVGLDDVRLVDAGLLHVGAGLAVGGAHRRGRRRAARIGARDAVGRARAADRALREVVDDVGVAAPPVGADQVQAALDVPRQQVVAGLRGGSGPSRSTPRARRRSPRPRARPVPAWSEPPYDVPATKAAPRPTTAVSGDEGAGDGARRTVTAGRRGMAGPSGVDLEVAGASALISGVR